MSTGKLAFFQVRILNISDCQQWVVSLSLKPYSQCYVHTFVDVMLRNVIERMHDIMLLWKDEMRDG